VPTPITAAAAIRAPKKIATADLATTLQAYAAKSVHDQGAPKAHH